MVQRNGNDENRNDHRNNRDIRREYVLKSEIGAKQLLLRHL
jgi:hypothetical protein